MPVTHKDQAGVDLPLYVLVKASQADKLFGLEALYQEVLELNKAQDEWDSAKHQLVVNSNGELVIDGEGEVVLDFQVVGNRVGYGSPADGPHRDIGIQATSPIDSEFDFRMLMTAFGGNQLRERRFWRNSDGILDCVITALQGLVVELRPRYHIRGLRLPNAAGITVC